MKKTIIASVAALTLLAACGNKEQLEAPPSDDAFTEDEAGAMLFGAAAVALCVKSGVCVF